LARGNAPAVAAGDRIGFGTDPKQQRSPWAAVDGKTMSPERVAALNRA
jgi:hypothetical protein